jgi:hypothetical protein
VLLGIHPSIGSSLQQLSYEESEDLADVCRVPYTESLEGRHHEDPSEFYEAREVVGGLDRRCVGSAHAGCGNRRRRENLIGAISMIQEPIDHSQLPKSKIVVEESEV